MINGVVDTIEAMMCELLHLVADPRRRARLFSVVESAVKLSRMCCAQRGQFLFRLPTAGIDGFVLYESSTMNDTSGQEDSELKGKCVKFALFPMLVKYGDEAGKNVRSAGLGRMTPLTQCRFTS